MRNAIVHIGAHKTGTTYLQLVFQGLRQHGLCFPEVWSQSPDQPGHRKLFEALASDGPVPNIDLTDGPVLISSEDLCYLRGAQVGRLRAALGDASVRIVFRSEEHTSELQSH